ncbi:MAG TPA: deoxyguanosinetriphosphate triphosphohydrolase [Anaerolineaceae bacterium]|nr:deoxyguanosinetriphosphate triphosphohydrolase [Anaerolineaceae bacterium]
MINTRSHLEDLEAKALAPYGMASRDSKGRLHPEDEPEYRTRFQRDRDRVLHTTAFRRLEYKTQVFINYEGDYYRTRLTHTLEVAQIGRTIARALGGNEDLTETICLAHDLGHPPFGHSGETTLNQLMQAHGGFDHNKQSFRIVTKLEERYTDFPGLNLTWEVLEGIVKHETEYDISDAKDFNPELRGNLEAQIANVADELAYTAHDLDDGLRSGMITIPMLQDIRLWQIVTQSVGWSGDTLAQLDRNRIIRRLIGILVTDVVHASHERLRAADVRSVEALQQLPFNVLGFSDDMAPANRQLKDFLYSNLYRHFRVVRMQVKAERVINELYQAYMAEPDILPDHIKARVNGISLARTVCDYLAGMTDRFAIEEYEKLYNPLTLP